MDATIWSEDVEVCDAPRHSKIPKDARTVLERVVKRAFISYLSIKKTLNYWVVDALRT